MLASQQSTVPFYIPVDSFLSKDPAGLASQQLTVPFKIPVECGFGVGLGLGLECWSLERRG